jgi:hypothetical protein
MSRFSFIPASRLIRKFAGGWRIRYELVLAE